MAELSIAAIWSRAMVRNYVGAARVDRFGDVEVRSIEIIFTGYADERKKRVPPRIGKGRPHALRACHVFKCANGPIRCDPFAGRMREYRL